MNVDYHMPYVTITRCADPDLPTSRQGVRCRWRMAPAHFDRAKVRSFRIRARVNLSTYVHVPCSYVHLHWSVYMHAEIYACMDAGG